MAYNLASCSRIRGLIRRRGLATVAALTVLATVSCSSPAPPTTTNTPSAPTDNTPSVRTERTPSDVGDNCAIKPSASNTGPTGELQDSDIEVLNDGEILEDARVNDLEIVGKGVTVRNVEVTGNILVTGDNATIDHVTATGIGISSASRTSVQYANISNGEGDGIHITSDSGRLVKNVVLKYNFIHSPRVPDDAHYDGTQVRGVRGLVISCSTYDPGPYQDAFYAAIYLEDANGGATNVSIEYNWLYGFGFTVAIDAPKTRIIGNRIGGDIHWGICDLSDSVEPSSLEIRDNVDLETGEPEPVCAE